MNEQYDGLITPREGQQQNMESIGEQQEDEANDESHLQ